MVAHTVNAKYICLVSGTSHYHNAKGAAYLAKRSAGFDTFIHFEDSLISSESSFEVLDLNDFKNVSKGLNRIHFCGCQEQSNTEDLYGSVICIQSTEWGKVRYRCESTPGLLHKMSSDIITEYEERFKSVAPPYISSSVNATLRPNFYGAVVVGALAVGELISAIPSNI